MEPKKISEQTLEVNTIALPTSREALKKDNHQPTVAVAFEDDDDEHRHNNRHRHIKRQHIRRRRRH